MQQETDKPKPYSYDWWWEIGYKDCEERADKPKHPKVKPYVDGWFTKYHENDDEPNYLDLN